MSPAPTAAEPVGAQSAGAQSAGTEPVGDSPSHGAGRRLALGVIRIYQGFCAGRPSPCRFYPSCSTYAAEAVERYGPWHGGRLAVRRITRCHPFGGHGVDLVPLHQGRTGTGPR